VGSDKAEAPRAQMKTVILAGGLGTRLSEETVLRPKPMVEVGGQPILWHILKIYGFYGFTDFLIAAGYKGDMIKEYFLNYYSLTNDFQVDLRTGEVEVVGGQREDWTVTVIDTGESVETGGRIKRLTPYLKDTFFATYGDGVANVNVPELLDFHRSHGCLATLTAVHPTSRFGALQIDGDVVTTFREKPQSGEGWINGGFFVFEPEVLEYIEGDSTKLELDPLERLSKDRQLMCFKHHGFWQPMDTLRELHSLQAAWDKGEAPWRLWD
jgi:glucose-1-phosphate cytidylyltransferase